MKTIRSIQAIFIAIAAIIYVPFLNKKNVSLIKEDFKHFTNWKSLSYTLWSFFIVFASYKEFRSVVYKKDWEKSGY